MLARYTTWRRGLATTTLGGGLDLGKLLKKGAGKEEETKPCDYIVVGGGSGGIACANRLGELGQKVVLFDHVTPSPRNSKWGFGGTCVNVGCIPKKLMHEAALLRSNLKHDGEAFGLGPMINRERSHDWGKLVSTVQNYVKSLNFMYASGLSDNVSLVRSHATLTPSSSGVQVSFTDGLTGSKRIQQAEKGLIIAVGGRPTYPSEEECPGAAEFGITSDDIFSLGKPPGRTLCVGGGYVSTEIASFLGGLGYDVTLSVRSIMLRGDGFDSLCAEKIAQVMRAEGVNVQLGSRPRRIVRNSEGRLEVMLEDVASGKMVEETFDTVLFGTGRKPFLQGLGLEQVGVQVNKAGKIVVNDSFESTRNGVYAIGDAAETGAPELTPVAVRQGELLAEELTSGKTASSRFLDVVNSIDGLGQNHFEAFMVPSTVFTATEYGRVGFGQESAERIFGKENIETYLMDWQTLSSSATHRTTSDGGDFPNRCLGKLVCLKPAGERVVGLHFVGPNAGEVLQGFALAVNLGATKSDFDKRVMGIHPTDAEALTGLTITTSSGENYVMSGGCGGGRCG